MDYYASYDYNDFYMAELRELVNLFPDRALTDKLQIEVMKRRNRLYHLEGYSSEPVPRNVPRVLVLNLNHENNFMLHPDAGEVFSSHLTFTLGQFGRMQVIGLRDRAAIANLRSNPQMIASSFEAIERLVATRQIERPDFIIYGNYHENADNIRVSLSVYNNNTGIIIGEFTLSESGREALPSLTLRLARRIYDIMPYRGRILRQSEDSILVNIGAFDGVQVGDTLVINKYADSSNRFRIRKKIMFTVTEVDTLLSIARPNIVSELDEVDSSDFVYPLRKQRARRIR
jgi:hypothetical protein